MNQDRDVNHHSGTARLVWGLPLVALALAALLWLTGWNRPVFLWLHEHLLLLGGVLWANLTMLGDTAVTPLLLVFYIRRRPGLLWAAVIAGVLSYAVSHSLKPLINEARPPAVLDIVVVGPRLLHSSFPSGHTTTIFVWAGLLLLGGGLSHRLGRFFVLLLAVLVGLSRIGVGVHWPVDVLAGAALGWLSAAAGLALASRWPWGANGPGRLLPIGLLLLMAAYSLLWHRTGFTGVWLTQQGVTLAALAWGISELCGGCPWKRFCRKG
ncbi:MAG: phosphatase PAP2 family protein [Betaproteobacteria bacterium]|nr:phosphatase PAP2 family protein [Betaproteobacteria bacterium]